MQRSASLPPDRSDQATAQFAVSFDASLDHLFREDAILPTNQMKQMDSKRAAIFDRHIKSLSKQFAAAVASLFHENHHSPIGPWTVPRLFERQKIFLAKWRRLFTVPDSLANAKEVDRGLLDILFQFFLSRASDRIVEWRGRDNALFFLTICDLWLVQPLTRYVDIYASPRNMTRESSNIPTLNSAPASPISTRRNDSFSTALQNLLSPPTFSVEPGRRHLSQDELYLPEFLIRYRSLIYERVDTCLSQVIVYLTLEYHLMITDEDRQRLIAELNQVLITKYGSHELVRETRKTRVPLQFSDSGFRALIEDVTAAACEIMAPAVRSALRFAFHLDAPKFLKTVLVKFNDMVVIYNKYLTRKYSLMKETGTLVNDTVVEPIMKTAPTSPLTERANNQNSNPLLMHSSNDDDALDLFLLSELQRMHEIHASIALTDSPQEVAKEVAYFAELQRTLKRHLFPKGLLSRLFMELFPELRDEAAPQFTWLEPQFDTFFFETSSFWLRNALHHWTGSTWINAAIINVIHQRYPELYQLEMSSSFPTFANLANAVPLSPVSSPASSLNSSEQRTFAEHLLRRLANEIFSQKQSIWAQMLGYEALTMGAVMQLFELLQRQVFVKNLLFQSLDYIVQEIESNAYGHLHRQAILQSLSASTISQWIRHYYERQRETTLQMSVFEKEKDLHQLYLRQLESTKQSFRSLFEYLQGSFATSLAKNLVDLISIRSTAPEPVAEVSAAKESWSAALGTKLLGVSSSLYGVSDMIGEFLVASIQETLGPSLLLHVGSMEELILKMMDSALETMRQETDDCKSVRKSFTQIMQSSDGSVWSESFNSLLALPPFQLAQIPRKISSTATETLTSIAVSLLSQPGHKECDKITSAEALEKAMDAIPSLESKSVLGALIAQTLMATGNLEDNPAIDKLWYRLQMCMDRHQWKVRLAQHFYTS